MTREALPAVIVQMPQTRGKLDCVERVGGYSRERSRAAEEVVRRQRQKERRRSEAERRRFAAFIAFMVIAALLAALIPWRGAEAELPAKVTAQPEGSEMAAGQAAIGATDKPEYIPDAAEVEALAKMLYGEARGVSSSTEKAACVWCVLNRVDDPAFHNTVPEVLEAPYQFAGYSADNPAPEDLKRIAADVLTRYHAEKRGEENVGRVLPAEYCFFTGDGVRNHFTIGWKDTDVWGWTLESPYED